MNLPNILTVLRFFLALGFVRFILEPGLLAKLIAALFFCLAAFTDLFDGYLARKFKLITNFGKIMDPIADKFLILIAFFVFAKMHIVALWMVVLICAREVFVTVHRIWLMRQGKVVAAEKAGKAKTMTQMGVITFILVYLILIETSQLKAAGTWIHAINILMTVVLVLTVYSGISYCLNQRAVSHA